MIGGRLGRAIRVGQALAGDPSPWTHAFVVVNAGQVLQAEPGGAKLVPIGWFLDNPDAVWLHDWHPLDAPQRRALWDAACELVGTPYSFLDYGSLALAALHLRPRWVRDYVAATGHMICSQITDHLLGQVGVHLFDDGRIPGDITPGDLHIQWTRDMSRRVPVND